MDISKQVMLESFYNLGIMLILLENLIPGPVREKIVVCHVRIIGGQNTMANLHEVTKLCKKTGFLPSWYPNDERKSPMMNLPSALMDKKALTEINFTEKIFARMGIDKKVVKNLLLSVKDGDIYNAIPGFPDPEHRSSALSHQASMLYVTMFFVPEFMTLESSKLREIVDKHFYDNWVIPVFNGYMVDLTNEWQIYDAARKAIENTVSVKGVRQFAEKKKTEAKNIINTLINEILPTGVLTNESVLQKMDLLLNLLREANVTTRWLMIHRLAVRDELREAVCESAKQDTILSLLLYSAQYELVLIKHLELLCEKRNDYWDKDKEMATDYMSDISEYFSEKNTFKKRKANSSYSEYFADLQKKIAELSPDTGSGNTSRKIQKYIRYLDDIEKYDQIENNTHIRQHIDQTKKKLKSMMKVLNLKLRLLSDFRAITDCSYSFLILKDYIPNMQKVIQKDASSTLLLRATFMKLSSIMDAPLYRLSQLDKRYREDQLENQSYNSNFASVGKYYSTELMNFVKTVLQVIPRRVFELASSSLVEALTPKIKSMPGEIDQEDLRDYALFDKRAK